MEPADPLAQLQDFAARVEALLERNQRLAEENRSLRHQQEQLVAEHQVRDELVGELVDGGGAEPVPGAERLDHRDAVGHRRGRSRRVSASATSPLAVVPVGRQPRPR